jgi:hypothetical protein
MHGCTLPVIVTCAACAGFDAQRAAAAENSDILIARTYSGGSELAPVGF